MHKYMMNTQQKLIINRITNFYNIDMYELYNTQYFLIKLIVIGTDEKKL